MLKQLKTLALNARDGAGAAVCRAAYLPRVGPFAEKFLSIIRRQKAELGTLEDAAEMTIPLMDASQSTLSLPEFYGQGNRISVGQYSDLRAFVFHDAIVSSNTSYIVHRGRLLASRYRVANRARIQSNARDLGWHNTNDICVIRKGAHREIPAGLLMNGDGAFNWYHFLLECLPKLLLARSLPPSYEGFPILVPQSCLSISTFAKALEVFVGEREVIPMQNGQRLKVKRVVYIEDHIEAPFNMVPGSFPSASDYRQHDALLRAYSRELQNTFSKKRAGPKPGARIFIARPGQRRDYNQDDLIRIAKGFGFKIVSPEILSLREQFDAYSSAEMIVGASGAAWANMIFCQKPFRGLSWLPDVYESFATYSTLATLLGHRIEFLKARTPRPVRSSAEAYTASYQISTCEFEAALSRMVGGV